MVQQPPVAAWKLIAIGLAAGLLGGGLGLGGGIVMVPLLVAVGLDRHRAHATSLAAIIFISVAGAISFGASGEIDLALGAIIGIGGILGSVLGASLMNRVSARSLTIVFGVVLLIAGIRLISGGDPLPGSADFGEILQIVIALGIGLVAGFFAGLAGIGGGVVIVPSTVILLGIDQHTAQGTSLVAIVFTAVAGTVVNLRNQRVLMIEAVLAGVGGIVGSLIGSQLALEVEGRTLSLVFGLIVIFVALRSLYRVFRPRSSEVEAGPPPLD